VPAPVEHGQPSAPATKKCGRPKGFKVSNETRLNMIRSWEDPARRQKYALRLAKQGMSLKRRLTRQSVGTSVDPDFDEGR
jgi:hypothetical protein